MNNEKLVNVLNSLIKINNDRIEGYLRAASETDTIELINMFEDFQKTSQLCKSELSTEVIRLGGTPTYETTTTGKIFRLWMDLKAAVTGNNINLILKSCEYGEKAALETYKNALIQEHHLITVKEQNMLNAHYSLIKSDLDKVTNRRNNKPEVRLN